MGNSTFDAVYKSDFKFFKFGKVKHYKLKKSIVIGLKDTNLEEELHNQRDYNDPNIMFCEERRKGITNSNTVYIYFDLQNNTISVKIKKNSICSLKFIYYWISGIDYVTKNNGIFIIKPTRGYGFYYRIFNSIDEGITSSKKVNWVDIFTHIQSALMHYEISPAYCGKIMMELENYRRNVVMKSFQDIEELQSIMIGDILIKISLICSNNKQWTIRYQNKCYYLVSLQWISPFYQSVIKTNVNVIEWDTTFYAASPYALCIPCAIIQNAAIPLGFALGTSENSNLYSDMFDFLQAKSNIKDVPILIDKGTSIISFAKTKKLEYYFCQRHIIENYGSNSKLLPAHYFH